MNGPPRDRRKVRLGDIAERIDYGHTASAGDSEDGPTFLRITDIQNGQVDWSAVPTCICTPEDRQKYRLERGDIVFARTGATTGKSFLLRDCPDSSIFASYLIRVRCNDSAAPDYLAYCFQTPDYWEQISRSSTGSAQPGVNATKLSNLTITLPPLPEQKRIVAILDEAFAGIDQAVKNTERNLASARELFESELNRVFREGGEGWDKKPLGQIAEFKNGLNFTKSSSGQTLRVVGVGDFQSNTIVPIDDLETATIDGELDDSYAIRENDILTVRSNGSKHLVGRCMLVPRVTGVVSFSGFVIRIRFDSTVILPRYLLHFMKSGTTLERITRDGGGTNISNINQAKLSVLPVPVPDLKTQQEMVRTVDELSAQTSKLISQYSEKLTALADLKQSILQKAFAGELTADDADRELAEARA